MIRFITFDCYDTLVAYTAGKEEAILSNSERAVVQENLARLDVPFDAVVLAEEVGACKPDHRMFEGRLARCGCACDEIVHVAQGFQHDIMPSLRRAAGPLRGAGIVGGVRVVTSTAFTVSGSKVAVTSSDRMMYGRMVSETRALASLTKAEQKDLNRLLEKLLQGLTEGEGANQAGDLPERGAAAPSNVPHPRHGRWRAKRVGLPDLPVRHIGQPANGGGKRWPTTTSSTTNWSGPTASTASGRASAAAASMC